jgi:hypothetical protein
VDAVFLCAVGSRIGNSSSTTINDSVSALFDAFGVCHEAIIEGDWFSTACRTNSFPDATKIGSTIN